MLCANVSLGVCRCCLVPPQKLSPAVNSSVLCMLDDHQQQPQLILRTVVILHAVMSLIRSLMGLLLLAATNLEEAA